MKDLLASGWWDSCCCWEMSLPCQRSRLLVLSSAFWTSLRSFEVLGRSSLEWGFLNAGPLDFLGFEAAGLTAFALWAAFRMTWHLSSFGPFFAFLSKLPLANAWAVPSSCSYTAAVSWSFIQIVTCFKGRKHTRAREEFSDLIRACSVCDDLQRSKNLSSLICR